jgi:hypothetical protein
MGLMLDHIEKDDDNLKVCFSVNDEFDCEDNEDKRAAALDIARSGIVKKPWRNI